MVFAITEICMIKWLLSGDNKEADDETITKAVMTQPLSGLLFMY